MSVETKELLNKLVAEDDINTFFKEYAGEFFSDNLKDFLNGLVAQKKLKISDIVRASGQGDYVYKVFNGDRKPSRGILIGIAIGMNLSVNETQFLLRIAKQATLDPRDKRDSIIIFSIKSGYDIIKTNALLEEMNEAGV